MRRTTWAAGGGAVIVVFVVGRNTGAAQERSGDGHVQLCSEATIGGDFGVQVQGTQQLPDGRTESYIGVIRRSYDGAGNVTQSENVKGSIRGLATDRVSSGTYVVNADCTGALRFEPIPGVIVETRFIIVDDGNEVRTMSALPPGAMVTGVEKRINRR